MGWDNQFYADYARHLEEPIVRRTHDQMFTRLAELCLPLRVIDYGCGTGEYDHYERLHTDYFGIDQHKVSHRLPHLTMDFLKDDTGFTIPFVPNAFISVFASEIVQPPAARYAFYRSVFERSPTIKAGMVAGFFYVGKEHEPIVKEQGGFTTHQTIEDQWKWINPVFSESRVYAHVPSKMWGDVIEVWKFFVRRPLVAEEPLDLDNLSIGAPRRQNLDAGSLSLGYSTFDAEQSMLTAGHRD